jgi:hypothetical protein
VWFSLLGWIFKRFACLPVRCAQKDNREVCPALKLSPRPGPLARGVIPKASIPLPTPPTFCRLLQHVYAAKVAEIILTIQEQVRGPAPKCSPNLSCSSARREHGPFALFRKSKHNWIRRGVEPLSRFSAHADAKVFTKWRSPQGKSIEEVKGFHRIRKDRKAEQPFVGI